ncbi:MAG: MobF family relaxase [Acidimicrobiales bacterium]
MRMMGADSVDYHRATVLARGDDHPGQALAYYASRGETPLLWGGSGTPALGLAGAVTDSQYAALLGPGGACDPTTEARLVNTTRPGLELIISAHKSVAELGVIGRAEDMHRIMDAERDATLAYLDDLTRRIGGRRGDAAVATPTEGLLYAVTRHATSRAGDPGPHDHVLVANLVKMNDAKGGWKAPDTGLWPKHLHAATMVGRMASAHTAVELGYAIVADPGPSGRLGHWAIAGVPEVVMDTHSKRAAEIEDEMTRTGYHSYRARNVAARATRAPKRHQPVGDLMPRWVAEIEATGWSVEAIAHAVDRAAAERRLPSPTLSAAEVRKLVNEVVGPDGALAARKVFTRRDVVVAVAPALYGRDLSQLARVVDRTLADPEAVPLVGVGRASERAYATAVTIAREQAIARCVESQIVRTDAAAVSADDARSAVDRAEAGLGHPLTAGQREAIKAVCTSGRGIELVVGIAGSGKTTALAAARDAFEAAGYQVVGTSTSGQAARTLSREAGIDSRTLASLNWRIAHDRLRLSPRHVAVLDEAAMSDDAALGAFLEAARATGTKVVMVGDPRQLSSVSPGGGFEAVVRRFGGAVHVLAENVRQVVPGERAALAQLRSGKVDEAVAWYAGAGRIAVSADRDTALDAVVAGWAADVAQGTPAAMYAWRRANVAELNQRGRAAWERLGRLSGKELAVGSTGYRAGDRIVTLAPGGGGEIVTSECGTVLAVDVERRELAATMDDGRLQRFTGDELDAAHLAHSYAVTVHRSQGATVGRAHAYEDGGGRELAYVKMSRARERSTVHVVADSLEQAIEDLGRSWSSSRRIGWAIDQGTPAPGVEAKSPRPHQARDVSASLQYARLVAERDAVAAVVPADVDPAYYRARSDVGRLERRLAALNKAEGWSAWRGTPVGEAAIAWREAVRERYGSLVQARSAGWRDAHRLRKQSAQAAEREPQLRERFEALAAPERARLKLKLPEAKKALADLEGRRRARGHFEFEHPEALRRLDRLDRQIADAAWDLDVERQGLDGVAPQARGTDRQFPWLDRIAPTRGPAWTSGLGCDRPSPVAGRVVAAARYPLARCCSARRAPPPTKQHRRSIDRDGKEAAPWRTLRSEPRVVGGPGTGAPTAENGRGPSTGGWTPSGGWWPNSRPGPRVSGSTLRCGG